MQPPLETIPQLRAELRKVRAERDALEHRLKTLLKQQISGGLQNRSRALFTSEATSCAFACLKSCSVRVRCRINVVVGVDVGRNYR